MKNEAEKIKELILQSKRILITSHENPDGDALGSMIGLGLGLEQLGKDVTLYDKDGVPELLEFLPHADKVGNSLDNIEGEFDMAFAVDCTGIGRAGREFEEFVSTSRSGPVVILDHHQTNSSTADFHLLDPESSSTGMIIYSLLKSLGVRITPDIARNIYATIIGDTGSFRYSNTSPETFRVAAELVEHGADPSEISEALFEREPLRKLKLLGLVLPTLNVMEDKGIASVVVDRTMFEQTGTSREDTEGIINIPRSVKGVEVAVLFREESDDSNNPVWKISLRSKGKADVARIAESFGGGGHKRAAGCSIEGSLSDVKNKVFESISGELG